MPKRMCQLDEITDEKEFKISSIVLDLISQLRKGADLHSITFPVFVLEPKSLLEKFVDFVDHPYFLLLYKFLITSSSGDKDIEERFLDIVKFFLSGWHSLNRVFPAFNI